MNDQSFTDDEENLFQHSSKKGSRKRLDTLTIENENSYEKLKLRSSGKSIYKEMKCKEWTRGKRK